MRYVNETFIDCPSATLKHTMHCQVCSKWFIDDLVNFHCYWNHRIHSISTHRCIYSPQNFYILMIWCICNIYNMASRGEGLIIADTHREATLYIIYSLPNMYINVTWHLRLYGSTLLFPFVSNSFQFTTWLRMLRLMQSISRI